MARYNAPEEDNFGGLSENYKDTSIKANNSTNQSNFAGTKYWSGGSSKIENYAGNCRYAEFSTAPSGSGGKRHPEGVKGGNSSFTV